MFICNAFSLQMLKDDSGVIKFNTLSLEEARDLVKSDCQSAIGHPDTAKVVSSQLNINLPANRINITLSKNDTLLVAQLIGGRLPEGASTLPDGFKIEYMLVQVL